MKRAVWIENHTSVWHEFRIVSLYASAVLVYFLDMLDPLLLEVLTPYAWAYCAQFCHPWWLPVDYKSIEKIHWNVIPSRAIKCFENIFNVCSFEVTCGCCCCCCCHHCWFPPAAWDACWCCMACGWCWFCMTGPCCCHWSHCCCCGV